MRPLLARETPAHDRDELQQIVEPVLDHIPDNCEIDRVVPVHEYVAKSDHLLKRCGQRSGHPTVALEQVEQLPVRARLAESSSGSVTGASRQATGTRAG